ncbi:MAG TPA: hypothetical protein VGC66_19255 [Pyrinomonadaceae bacterium]|jgi:glycine/D-amino acid oxidase-like deaminating enzyme
MLADVLIIGAGTVGLAAARELMLLASPSSHLKRVTASAEKSKRAAVTPSLLCKPDGASGHDAVGDGDCR